MFNGREPLLTRAMVVTAVTAVMGVLVEFGVDIPESRQDAIVNVLLAVGALVVALWGRGAVTPLADPKTPDGRPAMLVSQKELLDRMSADYQHVDIDDFPPSTRE